ncbi:zinc finger protein 391-like [Ptychodera flava]|uniref:zinc finger protein 391-like n=1 Tax=Ptychodera flava TaxID=63121 RepID=UPI00396A1870
MVLATDLMKKAIFQQGHAFSLLTGCKIFIRIDDPNRGRSTSLYYGSKELVKEYRNQGLKASGALVDGESGIPVNSAQGHPGRSSRANLEFVDRKTQEENLERNSKHSVRVSDTDDKQNEEGDDSSKYHSGSHADEDTNIITDQNGFAQDVVDNLDLIKREVEQLPCTLQKGEECDDANDSTGDDHKLTSFHSTGDSENESHNMEDHSGEQNSDDICIVETFSETYTQPGTFHSSSDEVYKAVSETDDAMPGIVYQCVYCNKVFETKVQLDRHEQDYHHEDRPFICAECGETFKKLGNLKSHQKVHSGLKPYRCDVCGRMFARSSHLKGHRYTHEKESPYKCQICGSCFTNQYNLKRHMLRHGGERRHHCSMCDLTFYRRDQLLSHERCHMKKLKR